MANIEEKAAPEADPNQALLELLPDTGLECCFNKAEFVQDEFVVDQFVKAHRSDVTLERLREQLSVYLKNIRLTLNDLINHDYADFVNLSSNLVGMDKSIAVLSDGLTDTQTELNSVIAEFSTLITKLHEGREKLRKTRNLKKQLAAMIEASEKIEKLESLLNQNDSCSEENQLANLEQVYVEIQQVSKVLQAVESDTTLLASLQERIFHLSILMSDKSKQIFIEAINQENRDTVKRMLTFHERNDNCHFLEAIVRTSIVKPKLDAIINDKFISENGLEAAYKAILNYAETDCKLLIELASDRYDFLKNSIWAEIIDRVRSSTVSGDFR